MGLHSLATRLVSFLPNLTKTHEFYGLRVLLALVCACAETKLYTAVSAAVDHRVGLLYLVFTVCAAGMFHSATAFLPSTFAMYTTMLGTAAFIRRRTVWGIFWFALGGLLGWPFSMAMCVPFIAEDLIVGAVGGRLAGTVGRFIKGGVASLMLLGAIAAVDSAAYRKLEIIPLNIVLYNVFGGEGRGPAIYGTEPWWFYIANLALNFNLLLPLALVSAPLLALHYIFAPTTVTTSARTLAAAAPFYLWLAIFTAQPHKEERFMFVLYPALCLNAALAFHTALTLWGTLSRRVLSGTPRAVLNWAVLALPLAATAALSLSRALAVVTAYSAPLHVYAALPATATGNLCLAKEWYRFPSSFFLPAEVRAKFVQSAFDGLLPGEFPESRAPWTRDGTWVLPRGMNDRNQPDPEKYVSTPPAACLYPTTNVMQITLPHCEYLVESYFERAESAAEQDLVLDEAAWEPLYCEAFLDAARTPMVGRTLWVPGWTGVRRWGRYCLFQRRRKGEEVVEE